MKTMKISVLLIIMTFIIPTNLVIASPSSSSTLENTNTMVNKTTTTAANKSITSHSDTLGNTNTTVNETITTPSDERANRSIVVPNDTVNGNLANYQPPFVGTETQSCIPTPLGHDYGPRARKLSYTQYSFFVGNLWNNPTSTFSGGMSVTFDGVSNTLGGIWSDDWVAVLPINLAYGSDSTQFTWVQFAVLFNYGGSVDFVLEQNNFASGQMSYGNYSNGREWSTSPPPLYPGQEISVDYTVGHTFFAQLFVYDASHVEFAITDEDTGNLWTNVMGVPSTNVLYMSGAFSPATTVEGWVSTSVTSITGFPYFEIDVINHMNSYTDNSGVNPGGSSTPPSGVDYYPNEILAGYWRWAALNNLSLIPIPVVQHSAITYPSMIDLGETATIDIPVKNTGGLANWMTIQVSFPTNPPVGAIAIDYTGTTVDNPDLYLVGYNAPSSYGFRIGSGSTTVGIYYPFVEGSSNWSSGDVKHLRVMVTPTETGDFQFLVKSVAAYQSRAINWDPTINTPNVDKDQQSEYIYHFTISVGVSLSSISVNVDPNSIVLGSGTAISGSITSSTLGDKSGTVYLQYSTDNVNWNDIGSTTSSSSGDYSYWWTPSSTGTFYVRSYWNGNSNYGGATSSSVTLTVTSGAGNLGDHTMCKDVQSGDPWDAIDRTNTFYTDDHAAYSWLHFNGPIYGSHTVRWDWYDPDGSFITDSTYTIPDAQDSGYDYWEWYRCSSGLLIDGYQSWYASRLGRPFRTEVFYDGSPVVTETWQVIKHDSSISISLSSTSITYGQSITISSQVTPSMSDGTTTLQYSTDQVNWIDISAGTPSNGYYSVSWTPPNAGTYYLRATWSGNPDYYDSTSSSKTLTVSKASTSLTTSLSSTIITYGSSLTVKASISPSLQGKTVVIQYSLDDANWFVLSSGTTNSAGEYPYTWSPNAETYYLRSTWNGDNNYEGSTSTSQQLTVNKASTSTSCSLSSNYILYGQTVDVTGTVNVAVDDGTMVIEYSIGSTNWDMMFSGTPSSGSYSYTWSPPSDGNFHIRATWSGNNNYEGSTSTNQTLTVESLPLLNITLIQPSNRANLTSSPILLEVQITSNGSPISGATVKFYVDGSSPSGVAEQIDIATTNSTGVAWITWVPTYTARWQWYSTANKTGYTSATSTTQSFWYIPSRNNLYVLPASSKSPSDVLLGQNTVLLSASSQTIFADPGSEVTITISYRIYAPTNPSEIDQLFFIASWTPTWPPPSGCYYPIYNGIPGTSPVIGSKTFNVTVPASSGIYYLWFCSCAHYSMGQAVGTYTNALTTPGHIKIVAGRHDVAIVNITPSATEAYPTWTVPLGINVTVTNKGDFTETFPVTLYWNDTNVIGTENMTLNPQEAKTLTYTWNIPDIPKAWPYPVYTFKAYANLTGDNNPNDNELINGTVTVKWPGDVDGDGRVGLPDLVKLAKSWYKTVGDPDYDYRADFDMNGEVKLPDLVTLAKNWYKGPLD